MIVYNVFVCTCFGPTWIGTTADQCFGCVYNLRCLILNEWQHGWHKLGCNVISLPIIMLLEASTPTHHRTPNSRSMRHRARHSGKTSSRTAGLQSIRARAATMGGKDQIPMTCQTFFTQRTDLLNWPFLCCRKTNHRASNVCNRIK